MESFSFILLYYVVGDAWRQLIARFALPIRWIEAFANVVTLTMAQVDALAAIVSGTAGADTITMRTDLAAVVYGGASNPEASCAEWRPQRAALCPPEA
ncbi:hypothetical protein [Nitratidesulfovibrio sp. 1201_IL3209]|uniref:hypothetical protein n=1 Tax=Nitratidesulfovibrio sp. 1201_IL3209 TaxID=3084053 RepID=UPI002FDB0C03